jgi:L-ascorbate metabolism protein UlaG (beta-lactamase superfamily)
MCCSRTANHVGDALAILKKTDAMLVANFEICNYHGGTVDCGGFTTALVNALHSSSFGIEGGQNVYLGNPTGLVLHFPDDKTLYHMGDTDIFGDMALIQELQQPDIGIVPIGDRLTMGGAVAAFACRRYFNFDKAIPCHYGSFPIIDQTAEKIRRRAEGRVD